MTAFRDNHPDRYGPIAPGDYVVITIGEQHHWIMVSGFGTWPSLWMLCGEPMPQDWQSHPCDFPMGGIVDCEWCERLRLVAA